MKKFLVLFIILLPLLFLGCPSDDDDGDPEPTPTPVPGEENSNISGIQYALYDTSDYTPIYSVVESSLVFDTWTSVSINVDAAHIGYDGFDSRVPANWTNMDAIRLNIITGAADEEMLIYFDNVKMTNGTDTPIDYNYDSSTGSFYLAKGTAGTDNNTLQTIDSETCVEIHGTSVDSSGSISLEFQYNLAGDTNCSGEDYVISFDYYMPTYLPE